MRTLQAGGVRFADSPKLWVPFWGVRRLRILVYAGAYWGLPVYGNPLTGPWSVCGALLRLWCLAFHKVHSFRDACGNVLTPEPPTWLLFWFHGGLG